MLRTTCFQLSLRKGTSKVYSKYMHCTVHGLFFFACASWSANHSCSKFKVICPGWPVIQLFLPRVCLFESNSNSNFLTISSFHLRVKKENLSFQWISMVCLLMNKYLNEIVLSNFVLWMLSSDWLTYMYAIFQFTHRT